MAKYSLTKNEKDLLKYAYTDKDRIDAGELFDYQVEALHMIRKCSVYLKVRYPKYGLLMVSFLPQTKKKDYTEIHFQRIGSDVNYTLRCKNDGVEDIFSDNFYDVPFEEEYDKKMEKELKIEGIRARVYTVFPFLISDRIDDLEDLLNKKDLSRNTSVFIGVESILDQDEVMKSALRVEEFFKNKGISTNCMVYFILDSSDMDQEISYYDDYVKDRKNQRNFVSIAFHTM